LWVFIGGIIGSFLGMVLFKFTFEKDIKEDVNDYLLQNIGGEI